MKNVGILFMVAVFVTGLLSFTMDQGPWVVPAKDKAVKNPVAASAETTKEAKTIYMQHCKACHGAKGLGDGPKAKSMKGDLGDFSSADFHKQTDGELFYKTKNGREDMPNFKKLSDEEIWLAVNYMRSLK